MITNIERPGHHRFTRSAENTAIVSENVAKDPNVSIPRRCQELGHIMAYFGFTSTAI